MTGDALLHVRDFIVPQIAQHECRINVDLLNFVRAHVARTHSLKVAPLSPSQSERIVAEKHVDEQVTVFGDRPIEHEPCVEDALARLARDDSDEVFGLVIDIPEDLGHREIHRSGALRAVSKPHHQIGDLSALVSSEPRERGDLSAEVPRLWHRRSLSLRARSSSLICEGILSRLFRGPPA